MIIDDTRGETINRAKDFIDNIKEEVYILGTNKYGLALAEWLISKNIQVAGFINDYKYEGQFRQFPVVTSVDDFFDKSIVNCIVEARSIIAKNYIDKCSPLRSTDYFALQLAFMNDLPAVDFLVNTETILENQNAYKDLFNLFEDSTSRQHFEQIINFRLNRDIAHLKNFQLLINSQYFESFLHLNDNDSFIDGGGFDGETTRQYTIRYPEYNKVFYFEPSEESFETSVDNLRDIERILFYKKGLWNKKETLNFDSTLSSANKISNRGEEVIETVAIDEIIDEPVGFIKLDIEGAEYKAVLGAKNMIAKFRPKLAICVYHNQSDFIRIPELVLSYNNSYKVYLRHYTQGVLETVMFFV